MDKIWIGYSLLGELSTASWGVIKFANSTFTLDREAWYNKLQPAANEGANICRVLPFSLFGNQTAESVFQPFKYLGNGKWDLAHYNDYYFPIMKEAIAVAKSLGITIWFELFDNCGLWHTVVHLNSMTHNVQGRTDYYAADQYAAAWVEKCLTEFGDTVKYGLGNELSDHLMVKSILPIFKAHSIVPFSYGADLDIAGEENHNSVRKLQSLDVEAVWGEDVKVQLFHNCHGSGGNTNERVIRPVYWWQYHSICFSDDWVFPRPQGEAWAKTIDYVLSNQAIEVLQFGQGGKARLMFECCPETPEPHLIIRDMVAECERFGVTFGNKGQYPTPWIDPVPPTPPVPEPDKPKITWQGWLGIVLIAVAVIAAAVLIF